MFPLRDNIPTMRPTPVHYALIGACVLVFAWQLLGAAPPYRGALEFGAIPAAVFDTLPYRFPNAVPAWATLITSQFLHGGWLHLIGNMMFLYIFGNNVEEAYGPVRFLLFYLVCGVAAGLAQSLLDTKSIVPLIGASGAISGVLGAYLKLFPKAEITTFFMLGFIFAPMNISARWFLLVWLGFQAVSALVTAGTAGTSGGTAFVAHVGGFLTGLALAFVLRARPTVQSPWERG